MNRKVLICEDSFEGILSGIYDAWIVLNKVGKENVTLTCHETCDMELFCDYELLSKNQEHAIKVAESIRRKISLHSYKDIYMTAMSCAEDKADLIFKYLQYGYEMGSQVSECMGFREVMEVTRLSKRVGREYDHMRGFLRFEEMGEGILSSEIKPDNDILELLGNHFTDRLPGENFIIKDVGRQKTLVHKSYCDYYIINELMSSLKLKGDSEDSTICYSNGILDNSEDISMHENPAAGHNHQKYYEELWKVFFDTITIDTRRNKELQRNNLPLRFRKYMTEFDKTEKYI